MKKNRCYNQIQVQSEEFDHGDGKDEIIFTCDRRVGHRGKHKDRHTRDMIFTWKLKDTWQTILTPKDSSR